MPNKTPFSSESVSQAVDAVIEQPGNSVDVAVEQGQAGRPSVLVEAQGGTEHVTWGAYFKTQFSKASTVVGSKIGFRW